MVGAPHSIVIHQSIRNQQAGWRVRSRGRGAKGWGRALLRLLPKLKSLTGSIWTLGGSGGGGEARGHRLVVGQHGILNRNTYAYTPGRTAKLVQPANCRSVQPQPRHTTIDSCSGMSGVSGEFVREGGH